MREILFRGKRVDNGKWVYGIYAKVEEWDDPDENIETHYYIFEDLDNARELTVATRVIQETVGQYTGLTDKNGTKIFEGDLIISPMTKTLLKVVFVNGCFQLASVYNPTANLCLLDGISSFTEVIGNIHDKEDTHEH